MEYIDEDSNIIYSSNKKLKKIRTFYGLPDQSWVNAVGLKYNGVKNIFEGDIPDTTIRVAVDPNESGCYAEEGFENNEQVHKFYDIYLKRFSQEKVYEFNVLIFKVERELLKKNREKARKLAEEAKILAINENFIKGLTDVDIILEKIEARENWKINQWEILEMIRSGGQAKVFRVKAQNINEICALKLFTIRRTDSSSQKLERYKKEVKALKELGEHENVIKIIDTGGKIHYKKFDDYYYVMEHAKGTLFDYLKRKKGNNEEISLEENSRIFDQIINSFIYIHSKNIIHRDIKPQNILFFDNNIFKIADFGINLKLGDPRITKSKESVGPRYYMAPELEEGRFDELDGRADIYSLGKLLYYLLSKGNIFYRERHREDSYNLVNLYADDRYEIFNRFFDRSIVYNRDRRFSSIIDLQEAFQDCKTNFKDYDPEARFNDYMKDLIKKNPPKMKFRHFLGYTQISIISFITQIIVSTVIFILLFNFFSFLNINDLINFFLSSSSIMILILIFYYPKFKKWKKRFDTVKNKEEN